MKSVGMFRYQDELMPNEMKSVKDQLVNSCFLFFIQNSFGLTDNLNFRYSLKIIQDVYTCIHYIPINVLNVKNTLNNQDITVREHLITLTQ